MATQNIVIVGAGIVGLSTAYALLRQGAYSVTVLEQEHVDHSRSTSHGISRLLRFEYGDKPYYSKMVQQSLHHWRSLEAVSRQKLYSPTGLLLLGNAHDDFTPASYETLQEMDLPISRLSRAQCEARFPQFSTTGYDMFTYNEQGGVLHASMVLQLLRNLIRDHGGRIIERCRVQQIESGNLAQPLQLRLSAGDLLNADRVVIAVGPWIHQLVEDLQLPVRLTRQYLLYFTGMPSAPFDAKVFPPFLASELYGFPIHSSLSNGGPRMFKAASHYFGMSVGPEENAPQEQLFITQTTKKLHDLLPALKNIAPTRIDSCVYDVTPDEDFILDTLPGDSRVAFATGLSGHGFKFGPLLGEIMSSIVRGEEPPIPTERFKLARFSNVENAYSSVA